RPAPFRAGTALSRAGTIRPDRSPAPGAHAPSALRQPRRARAVTQAPSAPPHAPTASTRRHPGAAHATTRPHGEHALRRLHAPGRVHEGSSAVTVPVLGSPPVPVR